MKSHARNLELYTDVIADKLKGKNNFHWHKCHELYYLTKGSTKYMVGEKPFFLQSGNLIFVPSGRMHVTEYENIKKCSRILLGFNDDMIPSRFRSFIDELSSDYFIYIPKDHLPQINTIYEKIEKEYRSQNQYKEQILSILILELIVTICRLREKAPKYELSSTDELFYNISKYIQNNFQENLSLDSLSEYFAINKCYLSRKFKHTFGIGVNDYLTYIRMIHAEHLLCNTDYPITRVATECGYNDSNYFSTVFKEEKGITPYKFKKMQMQNNR